MVIFTRLRRSFRPDRTVTHRLASPLDPSPLIECLSARRAFPPAVSVTAFSIKVSPQESSGFAVHPWVACGASPRRRNLGVAS